MKTCLVVDDSSVIRKVARRILEGMNFEIIEAEDGAEALGKCQEKLPDVVLLDWNMPNMDGIQFLRTLRKMPGGDRPKVVFCTTENDVGHIARALPRRVVRDWRVLPFRIASGNMFLASPEIPTDDLTRVLRGFTRLSLRFHLVTPQNFEELAESLL